MIFFRLSRTLQVAVIGGALAGGAALAGSGCWNVVDPAPEPMCSEVAAWTLTTTNVASRTDSADAEVRIVGTDVAAVGCGSAVCLEVTPAGTGTVDGLETVDYRTARFTYTNPALTMWSPEQLQLRWTVSCYGGGSPEEILTGTAWACRNDSGEVMIVESVTACPTVADPPPPPLAHGLPPAPSEATGPLRLESRDGEDGTVRLAVLGPRAELRWLARGGRLEKVSEREAIFHPDDAARTSLVQVAAFTAGGVSIHLFRRHLG